MLCGACQEKLDKGKITKDDLDVSRFLFGMSEKVRSLKDIELKKVVNSNMLILISGKGDAARLVGKGGAVVKTLAKKLGKSVKVLEESDFRNFMENLFQPIPIHGINTVYSGGMESYKIRVPISFKNRLPFSNDIFSDIVNSIFGKNAEIVFEK